MTKRRRQRTRQRTLQLSLRSQMTTMTTPRRLPAPERNPQALSPPAASRQAAYLPALALLLPLRRVAAAAALPLPVAAAPQHPAATAPLLRPPGSAVAALVVAAVPPAATRRRASGWRGVAAPIRSPTMRSPPASLLSLKGSRLVWLHSVGRVRKATRSILITSLRGVSDLAWCRRLLPPGCWWRCRGGRRM